MTSGDLDALHKTVGLMNYLAEVTDAAQRDPVRDIVADRAGAPDEVLWLDELPEGVRVARRADDMLLRVKPPKTAAAPKPPAQVAGWLVEEPSGVDGPEPTLRDRGPADIDFAEMTEPPNSVVRAFTGWLGDWRRWAREQREQLAHRRFYERLEHAAKLMEQQDDEYEFVLAAGLVCWRAPDGERIRRHLVTETAVVGLNRDTAEVTVGVGGKRRFEDREVFGDQESYQRERGRVERQAVVEAEAGLLADRFLDGVQDWLGVGLAQPFQSVPRRVDGDELPGEIELSTSPALLLRRRSSVMLAETYRAIANELAQPGAAVPVALAQLVMDTEPEQRNRWLTEQGAASGDVLGDDPLFPLPTNDEQNRVIELLRTETGVVVQGPPGTGKTHTIANLVSALLARGARVLVTSQKDQALRVLREKIPADLRRLCVLLAGGSKDAAQELERGLDALSEAVASYSTAELAARATALAQQRHELRSHSARLNERIRELREVEYVEHGPVVPEFSTELYRGTLTLIVSQVKRNASAYQWMPPVGPAARDIPPLSISDMVELLQLIRADTPVRRARAGQEIPARGDLPNAAELTQLVELEREARATAHADTSELTTRLAGLGAARLSELIGLGNQTRNTLQHLGFGDNSGRREWIGRAVSDRLAGRHAGLWTNLMVARDTAAQIQQQLRELKGHVSVEVPSVAEIGLGRARGLLDAGRALHGYLAQGGKVRKGLMKSAVQKNAAEFLDTIKVNDRPPDDAKRADAALRSLNAEIAAAELVKLWADAGIAVSTQGLALTLSELADNCTALGEVFLVGDIQQRALRLLADGGLHEDVSTVERLVSLLNAAPAALKYVELETARNQVDALYTRVVQWASTPAACSELGLLVQAIAKRDPEAYGQGLDAIDVASAEQTAQRRRAALTRTLRNIHPQLLELIERTATDAEWEARLRDLPAAWAWSKAEQFMLNARNADQERQLTGEYDQIEDELQRVTEQLAAAHALHKCIDRMSDTHARALRSYREHMGHVGAGTGQRARDYRKAARAAMEKAKDAVPAWVVPLSDLLDNIAATRDSFDVVIVDEASQVGLEHLFLLWMAPRVIVVGDDKQCSPSGNRLGTLENVFDQMREHLRDIDSEISHHFTSKSNLYGVLSSRSGKEAVVRLREHFRCMPEIINWSSRQFYGEEGMPGLIPLRERTGDDLEPLRVVPVDGAYLEGKDSRRRNPVEAKLIVEKLMECVADDRYRDKTFGIVVLLATSVQVKLLEQEINEAISPEVREKRKIRVGTAPNFQGDERDVIFLSTVLTERPSAQRATVYRQTYNVAASRAKDQMWLFTSLRLTDLPADDLRRSLMEYMLRPPSMFGESPELDRVSESERCEPFESLFEQRVFREIRARGYHVVPQHPVGRRRLDLVVVGAGGRIAVECDGHYWHTSAAQQTSDARRDRELRRMKWEVVRIRESEFEFDPHRELAGLWEKLADRGIHPHDMTTDGGGAWSPIDLSEETSE